MVESARDDTPIKRPHIIGLIASTLSLYELPEGDKLKVWRDFFSQLSFDDEFREIIESRFGRKYKHDLNEMIENFKLTQHTGNTGELAKLNGEDYNGVVTIRTRPPSFYRRLMSAVPSNFDMNNTELRSRIADFFEAIDEGRERGTNFYESLSPSEKVKLDEMRLNFITSVPTNQDNSKPHNNNL